MTEIILLSIAVILLILGFAEVLHNIKLLILSPKHKTLEYALVILSSDTPQLQIKYIAEKCRWQGEKYAKGVFAVNSFVNKDDFEVCKRLSDKYNINFCSAEEVCDYINTVAGKIK